MRGSEQSHQFSVQSAQEVKVSIERNRNRAVCIWGGGQGGAKWGGGGGKVVGGGGGGGGEQNAYAFCIKNSVNWRTSILVSVCIMRFLWRWWASDIVGHVLWSSFLFSLTFLSQNPRWHDPLSFDLGEQHAYLNVCVWCHNIEHIDIKPDRPTPPPHRDLLLGQVRGLWKRWRRCCGDDITA